MSEDLQLIDSPEDDPISQRDNQAETGHGLARDEPESESEEGLAQEAWPH